MTSKYSIKDTAGWTMFIFGFMALLLGLLGLARPEALLSLLGFPVLERVARPAEDYTIVFTLASAMASFNMGVYYILAAVNDLKPFYKWTVPFRGLTFVVFTASAFNGIAPMRFIAVGVWELAGAIATGLALRSENKK
jgi:Na+-driven multidrug efflux pump